MTRRELKALAANTPWKHGRDRQFRRLQDAAEERRQDSYNRRLFVRFALEDAKYIRLTCGFPIPD